MHRIVLHNHGGKHWHQCVRVEGQARTDATVASQRKAIDDLKNIEQEVHFGSMMADSPRIELATLLSVLLDRAFRGKL